MSWIITGSIAGLIGISALIFLVSRGRSAPAGLHASLELTRQDGWSLLSLSVTNRHDTKVWVERAAFVITALDAEMRGAEALQNGCLKIRENVRVGEVLRISAIEAVYNAAGKPQGNYSFLFKAAVRYRLGNRWIDAETPVYSVSMLRLTSKRVRTERDNGAFASTGALAVKLQMLLDDGEEKPASVSHNDQPSSTDPTTNETGANLARRSA
jgi:hypothetical protein